MGTFGPFHWLILLAVIFLLFGNRLPSVMRSLGQGVVEFKKGLQGIEDDVKNAANSNNANSQIEDQSNKPQTTEAKQNEAEPVQR